MLQTLASFPDIEQIQLATWPEQLTDYTRPSDMRQALDESMTKFVRLFLMVCGHWFRAIAIAKRNIFAGLDVFSFEQSFWEDCCQQFIQNKWLEKDIEREWIQDISTPAIRFRNTFIAKLKIMLRDQLSVYRAAEDGSFPTIT
ncbi:hypothetical protein BT63DRAFT_460574 [Microthyrium microscopicum]|uniref:Uncharacterized protein n=1 Tax=Microthyrium microscopicum TaxID=703497 RepID=A0A6A6TW33_9PEZI|nr:hypothetical protein BT63DRAFT_460574 [Microthyrium microscopicum]